MHLDNVFQAQFEGVGNLQFADNIRGPIPTMWHTHSWEGTTTGKTTTLSLNMAVKLTCICSDLKLQVPWYKNCDRNGYRGIHRDAKTAKVLNVF